MNSGRTQSARSSAGYNASVLRSSGPGARRWYDRSPAEPTSMEARSPMVHRRDRDTQSLRANTPHSRRRGFRVPILLGLIALIVALVPASAASAKGKVPKTFFGLTGGGLPDQADLRQMHDIKVRTVRLTLSWNQIEPSKGNFRWPDAQVAALARNGITPSITIFGAPQWATGSNYQGVPPLKGNAKKAWKSFLKKAVKRYKKGGVFWRQNKGLPKKPVKYWQIWNEPNLPKYFASPPTGTQSVKPVKNAPKAYAKFIKVSDKAIRKADKRSRVILAGLSGSAKQGKTSPKKFLKKFFKVKKVNKHFYAAALHPYAGSIKKYKSRISDMRKAMKKGGAKKKKLWLTEVGWGSASDKFALTKGLSGQAKILKQSFKTTLKKRKKWRIGQLDWFNWRDPPANSPTFCSFCSSAGLLRHDRSPKPAYGKFKHFTKLQGKKPRHHGHHG
jgi:hypothetical protein